MRLHFLKNPFYLYIIAFATVIGLYLLRWSDLFPKLSTGLLLFFILTFIFSLICGKLFSYLRKPLFSANFFNKNDPIIVFGIFFCYALEFLYVGHVPLFTLSPSAKFMHFGGIPTFHVFLVTFTVFYSVVLFHKLISCFSKKNLLYFFLILIPPLLMVNRGMFIEIFFAALIVYIFSIQRLFFKKIIYVSIIVIGVFYGFALLGNARLQSDTTFHDKIAVPSERFKKNRIPDTFLWPYMYATSPLGNLQKAIDVAKPAYDFKAFFFLCICPDFISKRIYQHSNKLIGPRIAVSFTVSTMYYNAYLTMGYVGMVLLFTYQIILLFLIPLSLKTRNKYYVPVMSITCVTVILNTFTNMWFFSAISFPIFWGILAGLRENKKINRRKNDSYCVGQL